MCCWAVVCWHPVGQEDGGRINNMRQQQRALQSVKGATHSYCDGGVCWLFILSNTLLSFEHLFAHHTHTCSCGRVSSNGLSPAAVCSGASISCLSCSRLTASGASSSSRWRPQAPPPVSAVDAAAPAAAHAASRSSRPASSGALCTSTSTPAACHCSGVLSGSSANRDRPRSAAACWSVWVSTRGRCVVERGVRGLTWGTTLSATQCVVPGVGAERLIAKQHTYLLRAQDEAHTRHFFCFRWLTCRAALAPADLACGVVAAARECKARRVGMLIEVVREGRMHRL